MSERTTSSMPSDDEEDQNLLIWSGLIPISNKLTPIADDLSVNIPLPKHLCYEF